MTIRLIERQGIRKFFASAKVAVGQFCRVRAFSVLLVGIITSRAAHFSLFGSIELHLATVLSPPPEATLSFNNVQLAVLRLFGERKILEVAGIFSRRGDTKGES